MDEMEQLRQNDVALKEDIDGMKEKMDLKEDIDGMKEKMDQMLEFMQVLANKENSPQPSINETNTTWPPYGLPLNYTSPI
jgi:uncharacterized protein (UPF0305 family)